MAGVVRNLIARAGIDLSSFEKGLKSMEKKLAKTAKRMQAVGKTMTAAFTAPALALGALSLKTIAYADDIATTATKINMSAEALQKWQHIAKQTDVDAERLIKGFTKFREAIGDRLLGQTTTATKALDGLGLTMEDLQKGTAEENFEKLVRSLSNIEDKTLQAAYANEIFGERAATDLIPLLARGGEAIDKYSKEFEKMGYLSNEQVAKLTEFDNEMNRVKQTVAVAGAQLGIAFMPIIENLLKLFEKIAPILKKFADTFTSMPKPVQNTAVVIMLLLAAVGPLLLITAKFALALKTMIPIIKSIAAAQWLWNSSLLASPITWIVLVIAGLVVAFVLLWKKCDGFKNFFVKMWEVIKISFKVFINFIIGGINLYLSVWKFMINSTIKLANELIKGLNKLPGVEINLIPKLSANALQIPKLANGGIVYGDSLVNVGEYANARSNPEVIAPLDKLKGMIGDSQRIQVYIGDDLITDKVVNRMTKEYNLIVG